MDIAWDGQYLWRVSHNNRLQKIDRNSGIVLKEISLSTIDPQGQLTPLGAIGLAWDGTRFWISFCRKGCSSPTGVVMTYDLGSGRLTEQFRTSYIPGGLAFDRGSDTLWVAGYYDNNVYHVTVLGQVIASFPRADSRVAGGLELVASPDIAVSMAASPGFVSVGSNLTYSITVVNSGGGLALGVELTDILPAMASLVSAQASVGSCSGNRAIVCQLGDMAPGARAQVTIVVMPTEAGDLMNEARAVTNNVDFHTSNNSVTLISRVPTPCNGVSIKYKPTSAVYRPTQKRGSTRAIQVVVKNLSGSEIRITQLMAVADAPFTITVIRPKIKEGEGIVLANKKRITLWVTTVRAAGLSKATATAPFFDITINCNRLAATPVVKRSHSPWEASLRSESQLDSEGGRIISLDGYVVSNGSDERTQLWPSVNHKGSAELANGVYFYLVRGLGSESSKWAVRKLIVLR